MELSDLEMIVARVREHDGDVQMSALRMLHSFIASNQGSVNFNQQGLFDKTEELSKIAKSMDGDNRRYLYDLLSVMNMFQSDQKVLKYRLMGQYTRLDDWGVQYTRKLVCCILDVIYQKLETEDYTPLVESLIDFLFKHNAEIEAIDFVFEVSFVSSKVESDCTRNQMFVHDYTEAIIRNIDQNNCERITLYLEEMDKFYNIQSLMMKLYSNEPSKTVVYLLKLNRKKDAVSFVNSIEDPLYRKQCLYVLARCNIYYDSDGETRQILSNSFLAENFFAVAKSLELLPSLKLDCIFKSLDKEKAEAAVIANSLIHFGYCRDPVFFPHSDDYKAKKDFTDHLKNNQSISVTASVGLIDSYSHEKIFECYSSLIYESPDVGAVLALAIASQRHHDLDSENINLLSKFLSSDNKKELIAAMLGIAIIYTATASQSAYDAIFPLLSSSDREIAMFTIFVLGAIFATTGDESVLSSCVSIYNEIKDDSPFCNLSVLGIALIAMKNPQLEGMPFFSTLDVYTRILALGLMHIGTGNPRVVDDILTESFTGDTDALLESLGLIAACLVAVGDVISRPLLDRICTSSLLLDSTHLKCVYPLCLALLYASNPKSEIVDALEKSLCSGESDSNSLLALGIVGGGTRSSRILRIFDSNYNNVYKDPRALSSLVISQGLVNLGKGLFTLSPLFYGNNIVADRPLIGLLSTVFLFLDQSIMPEYSFLCYLLSLSINPKYVSGYEGTCRVGRPVDVVGLTGKPNKIGGAVVHTLPIVLNSSEVGEVDDQICTAYVEDVLVRRN